MKGEGIGCYWWIPLGADGHRYNFPWTSCLLSTGRETWCGARKPGACRKPSFTTPLLTAWGNTPGWRLWGVPSSSEMLPLGDRTLSLNHCKQRANFLQQLGRQKTKPGTTTTLVKCEGVNVKQVCWNTSLSMVKWAESRAGTHTRKVHKKP